MSFKFGNLGKIDTDTEADEELGYFLFDNVAGDSVSVFSMREQQNQKEGLIQVDHYTVPQNPQHFSSEIHHSVQQEEHMIERLNKNKKPVASWHPCRSHNSGTYDEPPSIPPPKNIIFTSTVTKRAQWLSFCGSSLLTIVLCVYSVL